MNGELPKIHVGPGVLSNFEDAIQLEWIVTNGLGGYASSTALGINTRKYHGLLIAALNPPVDRQVVLTKLDEEIQKYISLLNSSGPIAIKEIKNLVDNCEKLNVSDYKEHSVQKIAELRVSEEGQEGINAFLKKENQNGVNKLCLIRC